MIHGSYKDPLSCLGKIAHFPLKVPCRLSNSKSHISQVTLSYGLGLWGAHPGISPLHTPEIENHWACTLRRMVVSMKWLYYRQFREMWPMRLGWSDGHSLVNFQTCTLYGSSKFMISLHKALYDSWQLQGPAILSW